MGIHDVPASKLIEAIAAEFKKSIEKPSWVDFVKTGRHRERAPQNMDWWYWRLASILYRVYKDGPVGTQRLRTYYGGRRNRGVRPHHFFKSSGKIVRACLQELEKQGFLEKSKSGRAVTGKGVSFLNKKSIEAEKLMEEEEKRKGKEVKKEKIVKEELKKLEKREKKQEKEKERKKEKKSKEKGKKVEKRDK